MGTGARLDGARPLVLLEVCQRPWSLPGIEWMPPAWLLGADGWDRSLLYAVHQILSLSFSLHVVQPQSAELLATTEGGGRREAAPRKDTRQDR